MVSVERVKPVFVVCPGRGQMAPELKPVATYQRHIHRAMLANAQFPNPIPGTTIRKPVTWYLSRLRTTPRSLPRASPIRSRCTRFRPSRQRAPAKRPQVLGRWVRDWLAFKPTSPVPHSYGSPRGGRLLPLEAIGLVSACPIGQPIRSRCLTALGVSPANRAASATVISCAPNTTIVWPPRSISRELARR